MDELPADFMDRLRKGDEAAWDVAFEHLYPCAARGARHPQAFLGESDIEDVAIDALAQLVPKAKEVQRFEELRALAVTMAGRRAISLRRKRFAAKRGGGEHETSSLDALAEDLAWEPKDTSDGLNPQDRHDLGVLLSEALEAVDERSKELLTGFLIEGLSYKELAGTHDMAIGTVGVLLSRGLKRIRDRLKTRPDLLKELQNFLR